MTFGESSDRTLGTNPIFNQKHSAYLLILLEVTREVEEEEEEERLTRNLFNRGLMLDISDESVRIGITITGDSLMTKDEVLVKIVTKNSKTSLFQHEKGTKMYGPTQLQTELIENLKWK